MIKPIRRIETTTPWELQDLALNGYVETVACSMADDFIKKFSIVLNDAANKKMPDGSKKSKEQCLDELMNFRELAKENLKADGQTMAMLSKPVDGAITLDEWLTICGIQQEIVVTLTQQVKIDSSVIEKAGEKAEGDLSAVVEEDELAESLNEVI
jgi:hypothetical protein